jgi:cyclophilin family peptidyl-prolyl cis-trans isomerase
MIGVVLLMMLAGLSGQTFGAAERWTAEKANAWYAEQPWLVGCNFNPSTAINQLEMWQADTFDPETIDRELGWAADIGMNTLRVYLHDLLWEQDSAGLLERMERFLEIADKHGMRTLFVLFDSVWDPHPKLGKQPEPKPHLHNSGWVQSPHIDVLKDPAKVDALEPYAKGVLEHFKNDRRVLAWDLYNEPGNKNDKDGVDNKDQLCYDFLEKVFAWAREVNPSQPLTAGVWEKEWTGPDATALNRFMLEHSDVISFHGYHSLARMKERVAELKPLGRPLLCTEYMARTADSTFAEHLPYFKENNIGAYNWGLVAGKTQTQYPWESWHRTFTAEPEVWFHEVFHLDGTPYDKAETDLFKKLTGKDKTAEKAKPAGNPMVKMVTSKGTILIELYADKAPITAANFLDYAKSGFYDGTIFHRVIPQFMIQGGGMTANMQQKTTKAPIKNESSNKVRNARGTLAMARTNAPDSATSQFFINHVDNRSLDFDGPMAPGYAVFGKVIEGMDVVDAIAAIPTKRVGPHANVPAETIVIQSVKVVE